MGNKMVYVEQTENGTTSKKIVEVENKVLEVASSDTSLSALSTDTIETEITDGVISSEVKKGSVSSEYLSSDLQKKLGKETLPLKKLFLRDKLPTKNDRIKTNKILKGKYDIEYLKNVGKSFELSTKFTVLERGEEYVKISLYANGDMGFIQENGNEVQVMHSGEWIDSSFTKIKIENDTEITFEQYKIIYDFFSLLYSAEEIIVLNREEIGYDFTPMLFSFKRRTKTHAYDGWYNAKSLFSRKKHIGYNSNGYKIPKRTTNMTLFDLLEWLGISSEGNNDSIWYLKDEIKYGGGIAPADFGFNGDRYGNKSDCERYFVIPLRTTEQITLSSDIIQHTIANSDILEMQFKSSDYGDYKRPKWTCILSNKAEFYAYLNFFIRMGVGKVDEEYVEEQKVLRYEIQDIYRVSIRMQLVTQDKKDFNGDFVGEMVISFKGSVEK